MIQFEYRSYIIKHDNGLVTARPVDGDDLELSSHHSHRIIRSIDQMWDALDGAEKPEWISDLLKTGQIRVDLDLPEVAAQIPAGHEWMAEVRELLKGLAGSKSILPEVAPSEVDPPHSWLFVPIALILSASIGMFMQQFIPTAEPAIIFSFAVSATAMVFGSTSALILTVLSFLAYDVCISPPIFTLDMPSTEEVLYALINLGISFAIPWLLGVAAKPEHQGKEESVRVELA